MNNKKLFQKQVFLIVICLHASILTFSQKCNIILGRPSDHAITASIMFDQSVDFYIDYGTQSNTYTSKSVAFTASSNKPEEIDLTNLAANTKYYYVVNYKTTTATSYQKTPEYSFHTQRAKGTEFTFTVEADEHLYDKKGDRATYQTCLNNQAKDAPDFMMTLGDIFGDDHNPNTITSYELDTLHRSYRPFIGSLCHSVPFYVCLGNHEGEMDYYMNKKPGENLAVWGTQWRKYYYPNPYPNDFYSGNTDNEPFNVGNPENYYAWTWGDAQFIVLDAYRDQNDTTAKPKGWDWSLGKKQYDWLRTTLETSTAKYKFVFCHHINGQGRGGITNATMNEWGGNDLSGKKLTYNFDKYRPGWGKPIHKLFVDNGVNIFFQGHDHLFAKEVLDGVVYQEVPMPSDSSYEIGMLANADAYTTDTIGGAGHIRVKVKESCITVDFVRTYLPKDTLADHKNGEIAFSYTLGTCDTTGTTAHLFEKSFQETIKMSPNPATDKLVIQAAEDFLIQKVTLHNAFGQQIKESNSNELEISEFPNGIYLVNITSGSQTITKKLIIQH